MRASLALVVLLLLAAHARADVVHLHTREVEALAVHAGGLWVASTGGLERYELATLQRTHHLTTSDGLDAPHVRALVIEGDRLVAHTQRAACVVEGARLACRPASLPTLGPQAYGTLYGARITARAADERGRRFVATYGAGLFVERAGALVRLTPVGQVCTHHVQAAVRFRGALFLGGFRDGLCVRRAEAFAPVEAPFRLVNDLRVHRGALYVAAHEGLFVSHDGVRFTRVGRIDARGVNGLATQGETLWIGAPGVIYGLPSKGRARVLIAPGGSHAVQAIAADAHGALWLATEDRGLVRVDVARPDGAFVEVFDALRGLSTSWLTHVAVAPDGSVYAATLRDGLYRVRGDREVERVPDAPRWLLRLAIEGDALWVASQEGLVRRDGAGRLARIEGLPDARVHGVLPDGAVRWIATEHGLVEQTVVTP